MMRFDRSLSGYNITQVNAFVDNVVDNVDEMLTKLKKQDLEIEKLKKELAHYKNMDATLNRAIVIAEEASNKYQNNSIKESDLIINEAKKNANRIINDALIKAESLEEHAQRLRRNIITYKRRIKTLIEQQAELIEDLDKVDMD